MRTGAGLRRLLALAVSVLFLLSLIATPVLAASRSFSAPRTGGFSSGTRSFSAPKVTTPQAPSRSYTTPKPSTSTPKAPTTRSYSSPTSPSYSGTSRGYTAPTSPSFSSFNRSFSSWMRSFTTQRPTTPPASSTSPGTTVNPSTPIPVPTTTSSYDTGRTRYPNMPPVVIVGSSPFDPWYWHDWYWGRPWWWRIWHRPVYYGDGSWAISMVTVVAVGFCAWVMLGVLSATVFRRRR